MQHINVHWIKNQKHLFKMFQNSVKWQFLQIVLKSYTTLVLITSGTNYDGDNTNCFAERGQ